MPLKLEYFNLRGAAELSRLILAYADEKYEDCRISFEEWPSKKANTPLGTLPVLTLENGEKLPQSTAISRYLANKFGLAGKSNEEKLLCDMFVETIKVDMWKMVAGVAFEKDPSVKAEKLAEARPKVNDWMQRLEKYVQGSDTVLKSGFSWADIAVFNVVNDLLPVANIQLDPKLTKLHAVVKRGKAQPKIAAWLAKRPVTDL